MFERILVLTDGSPCAALALPYAADLTRTYHSQLSVLYVVPDLPNALASAEGLAYTYNPEQERTQALEEGTRILEQARALLDVPGVNLVRLEAQRQSVAELVADQVERLGAGLVVMSTHGRSGLAHLFLGSVAEQVLRRVRVPVFMLSAARIRAASGAQRQEEQR